MRGGGQGPVKWLVTFPDVRERWPGKVLARKKYQVKALQQ